MNTFKIIVSTVVLFTINFLDARTVSSAGRKPTPQAKRAPIKTTPQQPIQQPIAQEPLSYRELDTYIKNAPNAWDNVNGKLQADFVTTIVQKARALRLDDFQLEALLQTARDVHGIFSGNAQRDIATLQSLDNQIATAVRQ